MSRHTFFLLMLLVVAPASAADTRVAFDLPEAIECQEKTPPDFAAAHPSLKVIEARFHITARIVEGSGADIVDFVYELTSVEKTMRLQDYLPNTTLESAVADDQIEVTNATENASAAGAEAHVVYKIFAIGGTLNQSSKKAELSHYKQLAPRDLVLASGTIDREHGLFFRLRPSRTSSLEGAKEFTFLATVPRSWRGDLCTISCTARAKKSSLLSTSVVTAGAETAHVGLYLAGDQDAAAQAELLRHAQETRAAARVAKPAKENVFDTISLQTVSLFTGKKAPRAAPTQKQLDEAQKAVAEAEQRLKQLAH